MKVFNDTIKKGHFTKLKKSVMLQSDKEMKRKRTKNNNFLGGVDMASWAVVAVVVAHGIFNAYHA